MRRRLVHRAGNGASFRAGRLRKPSLRLTIATRNRVAAGGKGVNEGVTTAVQAAQNRDFGVQVARAVA